MVCALKNNFKKTVVKRHKVNYESIKQLAIWKKLQIHELISPRSMNFFTRFEINTDFLNTDPNTWESNNDYKNVRHYLSHLKVINDCAERGVA